MFVPLKIAEREVAHHKIVAKQLTEYNAFAVEFQANFEALQHQTSTNATEQAFLDLMQGLTVKLDQDKYPFEIYLFNNNDRWLFCYDWKNDKFWCEYDRVWLVFNSKYSVSDQAYQDFILDMVEKHCKFRPSTTSESLFVMPKIGREALQI